MNDPAREPGLQPSPAPVAIECPQCGTQLRLLRPATVHTPIACCICQATFYLQPVETAPMSEPLDGRGPATPFRPIRPGQRPPERRPRSPDDPPPAMTTPPPPEPPGTRARPGMPKPVQLPEHLQKTFRSHTLDSVLGIGLVLLVVVGVCAGGFMLIKWYTNRSATADSAQAAEGGPAGADEPPLDFGPKDLPRPEALFGEWESRADDGSVSSFTFWPDGRVKILQASDVPQPPVEGNWYLVQHKGDDLEIEVGPNLGTVGNTRLTLLMTGPDAFTIMKHIHDGLPASTGQLRYIRLRSVPAEPPAKPSAEKAKAAAPSPTAGPR